MSESRLLGRARVVQSSQWRANCSRFTIFTRTCIRIQITCLQDDFFPHLSDHRVRVYRGWNFRKSLRGKHGGRSGRLITIFCREIIVFDKQAGKRSFFFHPYEIKLLFKRLGMFFFVSNDNMSRENIIGSAWYCLTVEIWLSVTDCPHFYRSFIDEAWCARTFSSPIKVPTRTQYSPRPIEN